MALFLHIWDVLDVLDRFGVAFKRFWEAPGKVFATPEADFSRFICIIALVLLKRSDPYKTLAAVAGAIKIKVRALAQCMKIDQKSLPGAFPTELPANNAPKM